MFLFCLLLFFDVVVYVLFFLFCVCVCGGGGGVEQLILKQKSAEDNELMKNYPARKAKYQ